MENEEVVTKELASSDKKCPTCASELSFDPKTKKLKCCSCGNTYEFDQVLNNDKHDLNLEEQSISTKEWANESKLVKCSSCGANIMINGLAITQECPYCGSKYIVETNEVPGLKPDCVVPFAFDQEDAKIKFKSKIKGKFFVPHKLKKEFKDADIKGIYIPAFSFDGETRSTYHGTVQVSKQVKTKNGYKTVYETRPISGTYDYDYCNLLVESSTQINNEQLSSITPYNLHESYSYNNDFLRGYYVEQYVDTIKDCHSVAESRVSSDIKSGISRKYTGTVTSLFVDTHYSNEKYNYQLLPLYYVSFLYKEKRYTALMNGQTGKVGKGLPISKLKVALVVFVVLVLIALVVFFIMKSE